MLSSGGRRGEGGTCTPEVSCELKESEFYAGISCKTNTVDILQKHYEQREILLS